MKQRIRETFFPIEGGSAHSPTVTCSAARTEEQLGEDLRKKKKERMRVAQAPETIQTAKTENSTKTKHANRETRKKLNKSTQRMGQTPSPQPYLHRPFRTEKASQKNTKKDYKKKR